MEKRTMCVLILSVLSLCMMGTGCGSTSIPDETGLQQKNANGSPLESADITVTENRPGEVVFDITIDDFIESCNSLYLQNREDEAEADGDAYLPPFYEWNHYNAMAVHGDYEAICYTYSEDESIRSIPTISIYVPTNGDYVQQVMISYDDHSYSIPTYEMYEELCLCLLRVMLPDTDEKILAELCTGVNDFADENGNDAPYSRGAVPLILYHSGGVGIYPYCALGEELHFCVIPVTEEILDAFASQGAAIYEVPSE